MNNQGLVSGAAAAVAGMLFTPAQAGVFSADPDDFPNQIITNTFPGITLTTRDGLFPGLNTRDVTSVFSPNASTGEFVFGQDDGNPTWGDGTFEFLHIEFDNVVTQVSLDFIANDVGGDSNAQLLAYNVFNVLVDIVTVDFIAFGTFETLTVSSPDIKFVAAYWDEITGGENGELDNLRWVPVPMPSAALLLAMGAVTPRRRRKR